MMKSANKLVRAKDKEGLLNMGFSETVATALMTPDYCGRLGFASYQLTNNNANIRNLKLRAKKIEIHKNDETSEKEVNGIRIVDNVEDNRLQIFFAGKPSENIRSLLKSRGFRWAPSVGCWQAYRGNSARWGAELVIKELETDQ